MNDNWHRDLLITLARTLGPKSYLELGLGTTPVLPDLAQYCNLAYGVDKSDACGPMPGNAKIFAMTTDDFFINEAAHIEPPDLVFVDADHRSSQVIKDLNGIAAICAPNCIVVCHDTFPDPGYEADHHCSDSYRVPGIIAWECVTIPRHPGATIIRMKATP